MGSFTNRQGTLQIYDGSATPLTLNLDFINSIGDLPTKLDFKKFRFVQNQGVNSHVVQDDDDTGIPEVDVTLFLADTFLDSTSKDNLIKKAIDEHMMLSGGSLTAATTTNDGSGFLPETEFSYGLKILYDNGSYQEGFDYPIVRLKQLHIKHDKDVQVTFKVEIWKDPTEIHSL
jgi:hypothetical protein